MTRPIPPTDAQLYRVAWDSYGRKTKRAPRLHLAWRDGRIWHTLCGHATLSAEPVAEAAPICAVCQDRHVRILWVLHMTHVIDTLRELVYAEGSNAGWTECPPQKEPT